MSASTPTPNGQECLGLLGSRPSISGPKTEPKTQHCLKLLVWIECDQRHCRSGEACFPRNGFGARATCFRGLSPKLPACSLSLPQDVSENNPTGKEHVRRACQEGTRRPTSIHNRAGAVSWAAIQKYRETPMQSYDRQCQSPFINSVSRKWGDFASS